MRRLAVLLSLLAATAAHAQVPADSSQTPAPETPARPDPEANEPDAGDPGSINDGTAVDDGGLNVRPRLAPSALYSSNLGIGFGAGVAVDNVGWRGTELGADVRVQHRALGAGATFATADPYAARVFGLVSASATTTSRRLFFGVGPFSGARALALPHNEVDAEIRAGVYPLGSTALLVQPGVRFLLDRSGEVRGDSPASLGQLDAASRAAVEPVIGETRTGLSAGVDLTADFRDWPAYPRSGVVVSAEARRFFGLDARALRFTRTAVQSTAYTPIYGRTVLFGSVVGVVTRQGDADGDGAADPIPYYYLPTLDERAAVAYRQDRLTGRDLFALSAGVRAPLYDFLGVYGIDAVVVGYLGNVYDDIFEQFSPAVTFGRETAAGRRAALRPALGLGLGVVNLDKERVVLGALVGIGAGGITVASLQIAYNLRDSRPLFR